MSEVKTTQIQVENKAARTLKTSNTVKWLNKAGVFVIVAVLVLAGALFFPSKFLTGATAHSVLSSVTIIAIISIGVSFITYSGHYVDLSIPSLIALVGFVTVSTQQYGFAPCLLCGLGAGVLVGGINGYIVGYLRVNPIIWTLAMNFLLAGFNKWVFVGQKYPDTAAGTTGHTFLQLSEYEFPGHIPLATAVLVVMIPLAVWLMKHSLFGTQVRLVGAAYEPARLSGVNVRAVVLMTFMVSALTSAVAAIFLASGSQAATFELGNGYDFSAVTAVVLGGVLLSGGAGSVLGVLGGVLVIGLLEKMTALMGWSSFDQAIVKGIVFASVVGLTSWFARKGGARA